MAWRRGAQRKYPRRAIRGNCPRHSLMAPSASQMLSAGVANVGIFSPLAGQCLQRRQYSHPALQSWELPPQAINLASLSATPLPHHSLDVGNISTRRCECGNFFRPMPPHRGNLYPAPLNIFVLFGLHNVILLALSKRVTKKCLKKNLKKILLHAGCKSCSTATNTTPNG